MGQTPDSDTLTDGIRVRAAAQLLEDESDPARRLHVYGYRIRIENEGNERAQLLSRRWIVLDADNKREEIVGDGVVGRQPDLAPGEMFEYTSRCPLRTEWGTMEGSYTFRRPGGERFEVAIGRFFLVPGTRSGKRERSSPTTSGGRAPA